MFEDCYRCQIIYFSQHVKSFEQASGKTRFQKASHWISQYQKRCNVLGQTFRSAKTLWSCERVESSRGRQTLLKFMGFLCKSLCLISTYLYHPACSSLLIQSNLLLINYSLFSLVKSYALLLLKIISNPDSCGFPMVAELNPHICCCLPPI